MCIRDSRLTGCQGLHADDVSALACRKNPQTKKMKKKRSRVKTISRVRGSKTPEHIVMKFCMMVGLPDLVTRAKLDGDRFSHFRVVGGRISGFPIDFASRPYNTLALPCQSVIFVNNYFLNYAFKCYHQKM